MKGKFLGLLREQSERPEARSSDFLSEAEVTFGGESGIRTHGAVARTTVFETVQFNHSCISPQVQRRSWKKD